MIFSADSRTSNRSFTAEAAITDHAARYLDSLARRFKPSSFDREWVGESDLITLFWRTEIEGSQHGSVRAEVAKKLAGPLGDSLHADVAADEFSVSDTSISIRSLPMTSAESVTSVSLPPTIASPIALGDVKGLLCGTGKLLPLVVLQRFGLTSSRDKMGLAGSHTNRLDLHSTLNDIGAFCASRSARFQYISSCRPLRGMSPPCHSRRSIML
jgi:hypothetical protein